MLSTRVIPVLLLKGEGLYKSVKFNNPKYVGDPINAIKIFNEKEVDEIVVLDIDASPNGKGPNFELIENMANEAFMPLGYGGGITTLDQAKKLFNLGVEKVILNSVLIENPNLVTEIANEVGSQSVVVCVDVKKNFWGKYECYGFSGKKSFKQKPEDLVKKLVELGAGEIIINSIDNDGTFVGYDLPLIKQIADSTNVPVIASGGASSLDDFREAVLESNASAVAAGSMFVFHGKHRAVLITYPNIEELENTFK